MQEESELCEEAECVGENGPPPDQFGRTPAACSARVAEDIDDDFGCASGCSSIIESAGFAGAAKTDICEDMLAFIQASDALLSQQAIRILVKRKSSRMLSRYKWSATESTASTAGVAGNADTKGSATIRRRCRYEHQWKAAKKRTA